MRVTAKNTMFLIAIVIAIGAATYSFLMGGSTEATQVVEQSKEPVEKKVILLSSTADLKKAIGDHDFLYVIMPGPEKDNGSIIQAALAAAIKAGTKKEHVGVAELSRTCDEYSALATKFGVKRFPAVIGITKDGATNPIQEDISEESLLKAYLAAAKPKSPSCPYAKKHGGCDPSKCGF